MKPESREDVLGELFVWEWYHRRTPVPLGRIEVPLGPIPTSPFTATDRLGRSMTGYYPDDRPYWHVDGTNEVFQRHKGEFVPVSGAKACAVLDLVEQNRYIEENWEQIEENRRAYAQWFANGHTGIERLLLASMWFENGPPELFIVEAFNPNVTFAQVGRNASHSFYMGVDDHGRYWKISSGEELMPSGKWGIETVIYPVQSLKGYWGHR